MRRPFPRARRDGIIDRVGEGELLHLDSRGLGFDRRERLRRLGLRGLGLSTAAIIGLAVLAVVADSATPCLVGVLGPFAMLGSFIVLMLSQKSGGPSLERGAVDVVDDVIQIQVVEPEPAGEVGAADLVLIREIPLSQVTQGWIEAPDRVHLLTVSGEALVVRVDSAADRERLLRAVGVGAAERVLRVPLASAASQLIGGPMFGTLLLMIIGFADFYMAIILPIYLKDILRTGSLHDTGTAFMLAAVTALLSLAAYAVFSAMRRREAVIGTDGVAYRGSFRTQFIPYESLDRVDLDTRGVVLSRKKGPRVLLRTATAHDDPLSLGPRPSRASPGEAEVRQRLLRDRIREAMEAREGSDLSQVALDRLDRNDRSIAKWQEDLRRLLSEVVDYRGLRVSTDDLGGVIEDAGAPAERRIAAAVALSASEQVEARRRVRIAVQACADEDLRRALESAAEGEIDEALIEREARGKRAG